MGQQTTDSELVTAARQGDRDALGELFTRHRSAMRRAASGALSNPDDIEDAIQHACLLACLHLRSLRQPEAFGSWLCRIARRTAQNARRSQGHEVPLEDIEPAIGGYSGPDGATDAVAAVREALSMLPEVTRRAVALRYLDGHSLSQIAALLCLSEDAVTKRLSRARMQLRRKLDPGTKSAPEGAVVYGCSLLPQNAAWSCHAVGARAAVGSQRGMELALLAYYAACLDPALASLVASRPLAEHAAAEYLSALLDDGLQAHAPSLTVHFQDGKSAHGGPSAGLSENCATLIGGSLSWSLAASIWRPLAEHLAVHTEGGVYRHSMGGREHRIPIASPGGRTVFYLGRAEAALCAAARPTDSWTARGVQRVASMLVEGPTRDACSAVSIRRSQCHSRIDAYYETAQSHRVFLCLHAQATTRAARGPVCRVPLAHPLWNPLREALAELAGIELLPGARRQTTRFEFVRNGTTRHLRATFTGMHVTVEPA